MKRIVTVIVMASAILVALPSFPVGASRVADLQCGVNPTTSVRLRADLTCSERFQLAPTNPPITIDLDGHTLTFTDRTCLSGPPISRCDITDPSGSVTIIDGTIAGSVSLGQNFTEPLQTATLSRVHVTDRVDALGKTSIVHSVLDAPLSAFGPISLQHNTLRGGVRVSDTLRATPLDIVDNVIVGSSGAGIDVNVAFDFDRVGGTISGNAIRSSAGAGIDIHGQGSNGLGELTIVNNALTGNGGDGISYAQDNRFPERYGMGPVVITNNTTRQNGGHGINIRDAATGGPADGVFDGGRNTARYNALSPRCIGVRCTSDGRSQPVITWARPAAIDVGTALGPDQLNATASVPGRFTYTPDAGTVLDPGGYSLTVKFVPDDLVHYQPVTWGVGLEVRKIPILPAP